MQAAICVAYIKDTNILTCVYDRCPKVTCKSRVIYLDNGLYKCNKCEADYYIPSNGIRLILDVHKSQGKKKCVVMFNDMAERFLDNSATLINMMSEDELNAKEKSICMQLYKFIVFPGKQSGDYICEGYDILEESRQIEKCNSPSAVTDKNYNIIRCHPSKRAYEEPATSTITSNASTDQQTPST